MRALEKAGVENYIVSGSPDIFVKAAGIVAGVPRERCVGIRQKIAGGRLSTELKYPLSMNEGKVECVREILNSRSCRFWKQLLDGWSVYALHSV